MKKLLFTLGIFFALPCFGAVELMQIIVFDWDESTQKLKAVSLGSGTAIDKGLVLTNKHVVTNKDGEAGDFLLLCPAKHRSTHNVECNIPAVVTVLHPTFDAALIKPLSNDVYLPQVRLSSQYNVAGDRIRVQGFPVPVEGLQNFGGLKTFQNVKEWQKNGGDLKTGGDKLTITRGQIKQVGKLERTGEIYYITDVKVNFGNSGGAAFDENNVFVGIPTLRDTNFNALVLAYPQLLGWIHNNKNKKPSVTKEVQEFYEEKIGSSISTSNARKRRSALSRLQRSKNVPQSFRRSSSGFRKPSSDKKKSTRRRTIRSNRTKTSSRTRTTRKPSSSRRSSGRSRYHYFQRR